MKLSVEVTLVSAVAMAAVVCQHLPTLPKSVLFDWAVPWFFFASGFWYAQSERSYSEQVRRRVRTLLVPYFLWNVIWFPILFCADWLGSRYFQAPNNVSLSIPCLVRCLGLDPTDWPALVPTWYLRALFVAVVAIGGLDVLARRFRAPQVVRLIVCAVLWTSVATQASWMPDGASWRGFFSFGVPLVGCACLATGLLAGSCPRLSRTSSSAPPWLAVVRRQMMPIYLLHVPVILSVCWLARALGIFGLLATTGGDVAMWFVAVLGAIASGLAMKRCFPRLHVILFGGR